MHLADKHEGTTTKAFAGLRVLDFSITISAFGEHARESRKEIGLSDAASIPSGKTAIQG